MTDFDPDIFLRKTVRKDWIDLRDQNYTPNLSVLREEMFIDPQLMPRDETTGLFTPRFTVRDQKASGRCAGFAAKPGRKESHSLDCNRSVFLFLVPRRAPERIKQGVLGEVVSGSPFTCIRANFGPR